MSDLSRRSLLKGLLASAVVAATPDELLFYGTPPELRKKFFFFERQPPHTVAFKVSMLQPGDRVGIFSADGQETYLIDEVVDGNTLTLYRPIHTLEDRDLMVRVRRGPQQGNPIIPFETTVPAVQGEVLTMRVADEIVGHDEREGLWAPRRGSSLEPIRHKNPLVGLAEDLFGDDDA